MFENVINFFKKIGKKDQIEEKSKDTAKERLHLVLMQDRANVSADFLDMMRQEIIEVIKKYIDVDEKDIDVRLTNKTNEDGTMGAPALYANIPITGIKEEMKKEKIKEETKDVKVEEVNKEKTESQKDDNKTEEEKRQSKKMDDDKPKQSEDEDETVEDKAFEDSIDFHNEQENNNSNEIFYSEDDNKNKGSEFEEEEPLEISEEENENKKSNEE